MTLENLNTIVKTVKEENGKGFLVCEKTDGVRYIAIMMSNGSVFL